MTMLQRVLVVLGAMVLIGVGFWTVQLTAESDTERCVSRIEYDRTESLLSTEQVANRYDVPGYLVGVNDEYFRRGYRNCWNPEEIRIVVAYNIDNGLSHHWDTKQIDR